MKSFFQKNKLKNRGVSIVEALVGVAIVGIIIMAIITFNDLGVKKAFVSLEETQAVYLAEEGVEAMKSIRDIGWTQISGMSTSTTYYLEFFGNNWRATTTASTIDGKFTRTINVAEVKRDGLYNIATTGAVDNRTKKITVSVSWSTHGEVQTRYIPFYLADISS